MAVAMQRMPTVARFLSFPLWLGWRCRAGMLKHPKELTAPQLRHPLLYANQPRLPVQLQRHLHLTRVIHLIRYDTKCRGVDVGAANPEHGTVEDVEGLTTQVQP